MNKRLVERIPFAKILIGLVIVFVLSMGLCGLSSVLTMRGKTVPPGWGGLMNRATGWDVEVMVLSLALIVVTGIIWVVAAAMGSLGKKVSQPEKRLDEGDDRNHDKNE